MADYLDQLLSQGAQQPTDHLDALLSSQVAPAAPTAPGPAPSGFMRGLQDVGDAGAQLLYHAVPQSVRDAGNTANNWLAANTGLVSPLPAGGLDQSIQQGQSAYDAARKASGATGFDWSRAGGNVVGAAPAALGAALAVPAAGLGTAALTGAGLSALTTPVQNPGDDFWKQKALQAGIGAVAGPAGQVAGNVVGGLVSPVLSSGAKMLADQGVTLTPGQALGGAANRIEQGLTAVPFVGDLIKNAQGRSFQDLNRAAYNQALAPIGESLSSGTVGYDAAQEAATKIGANYDRILNNIGSAPIDQQFVSDLASLRQGVANMPPDHQSQFDRIVRNELLSRINGGQITGDQIKAAESTLGKVANNYANSTDYDVQGVGSAVKQTQGILRSWLARVSPQNAAELQSNNQAWSLLQAPQRASGMTGSAGGVFTPDALLSATKATAPSATAFARGQAPMQDLAAAAKDVMGSKVPDSGTPFRGALQLGAAALLGHPYLPESLQNPLAAGGVAAMALPYTTTGQKLAAALLTAQRPQALQTVGNAIRAGAPYVGAAGAANLISQPR